MIKRKPKRHDIIEIASNFEDIKKGVFTIFKPLGLVTKVKGNVAHVKTEEGSTCFIYAYIENGYNKFYRIGE